MCTRRCRSHSSKCVIGALLGCGPGNMLSGQAGLTYLLVTAGSALFLDIVPEHLVSPLWLLLNLGGNTL